MEDHTPPSEGNGSQPGKRVRRKRARRFHSRRPGWRRTLDKWADCDTADVARVVGFLIEGLLVATVALAPVPLGSVSPWARSILFLDGCLLLFLWVVRSSLLGRLEVVRTRLWVFIAAYLLILCFQLMPLPHRVLSILSPCSAELYAWLVPGFPERSGPVSVSMNPHATVQEIFRVLTFALVLFVFLNHFRDRRQITRILWALVALGLFQSFYGLAERFSGHPHIFWITPRDTVSVHGTYYNRNHFAGLMEMLTPAVFGFFLASLAARSWSRRSSGLPLFRQIEQALSKGSGYRSVLLGLVVTAMFLAAVLSLSRGGTAGLLVGFLILFSFTRKGEQRGARTARVFVFVLLAALGFLFYRGVGGIVDRFEQLAEDDSSWAGRKALRQAGARMIRDFPVLGVGGGAFRYVFPAYQPERYGDRAARYLHNDWLQVACETGVVGAVVAFSGLAVFLLALLRRIRRRQDPYCKLIFGGAFAGVAAMLLHSLVDFNLYMVTANGLVFTVLLGTCHTAVYMKGRSRGSREAFPVKVIEMPGKGLRIGLPALVLAACLPGMVLQVRSVLADFAFNRYRAWARGEPQTYFFWEPGRLDEQEARDALAQALALQPLSAEYNFAQGFDQVKMIKEKILSLARERARAVRLQGREEPSSSPEQGGARGLAREISKALEGAERLPHEDSEEESEEFRALVSAFTDPARRQLQEEIRADLAGAEQAYRKAMRMAPTVPWYRMDLAMAYAELLGPGPALQAEEREKVDRLVREALALAPNRPLSLFSAGRYWARGILYEADGLDPARERDRQVLAMFGRALSAEPGKYAHPTYEFLMDEARADPEMLLEVTPDTLVPQQRLLGFLIKRGMWVEALGASENVLALLGVDPRAAEIPPDIRPDTSSFRLSRLTTLHQLRILQRLGMLRRWQAVQQRYRAFVRAECRILLDEASRYTRLGRLAEVTKSCTDCLELDWNNLGAFLTLEEIRLLPGASGAKGREIDVLQELLRFLQAHPAPARSECERIGSILLQVAPDVPTDHLKARLAAALKDQGCGDPAEASRILRDLLLVDARPFVYWHQRHLLHYHLGRSLEMSGSADAAVSAYADALGLAPAHRPSLERLVALGAGDAVVEFDASGTLRERLRVLTPDVPWSIDLSGKVRFLGITLEGAGVQGGESDDAPAGPDSEGSVGQAGFTARYLWEVEDDLDPTDYIVVYRYFDADGNLIYGNEKSLYPDPKRYGENLDGGIGTVLVHWDYLTFPPAVPREVRILVRQKGKVKVAPPPLTPISGDRWLILGLGLAKR